MIYKALLFFLLLNFFFVSHGQDVQKIKFRNVSCAEKWWVAKHPFVARKAKKSTYEVSKVVEEVKQSNVLTGNGDGGQVDAFRHTYWMAILTQEIGWKRAKSLGIAHEKGNYRAYKKRKNEDGKIPDKVSTEMDLYNNEVGIRLGEQDIRIGMKELVVEAVLNGNCKIIKVDKQGNYLDCYGKVIVKEDLKGKWENNKCMVDSNWKHSL